MGKVNFSSIFKKVANSKSFQRKMEKEANKKFEQVKKQTIQDFNEHPITLEIEAGPTASNSSGTLGGYGNLFSFIGFNSSDRPTSSLRSLIKRTMRLNILKKVENNKKKMIEFKYKATFPTKDEIMAATPMPWEGGSWADAMEKGMSNFSFYMYKRFGGGRSGYGFQADHELRYAIFKPKAYISEVINNFKKNVKEIK